MSGPMEQASRPMPPRVRDYAAAAAREHGVSVADVLGRGRTAPVYAARQRVMRQLRVDGFSSPLIGRWMGRHHSTVLHALATLHTTGKLA